MLVGDRGMLTTARIEEELRPVEGLDWISALRNDAVRQLAADDGPLQLSLFDLRDHSTAIAATAQIVRNFVDTPQRLSATLMDAPEQVQGSSSL